jgi:hypothetical protein
VVKVQTTFARISVLTHATIAVAKLRVQPNCHPSMAPQRGHASTYTPTFAPFSWSETYDFDVTMTP